MSTNCPICKHPVRNDTTHTREVHYFDCVKCGTYLIDEFLLQYQPGLLSEGKLCALINQYRIKTGRNPFISCGQINKANLNMIEEHYDFLKFSETLSTWPEKVTQRLEMAFFLFSNEYGTMGQHFQVDSGSAIKFGLLTNVELEFALFTWRSLDYLNLDADSYHFITPKGWEYLESITAAAAKIKRLKQVFVAMSFNPEHEDIYNLAIEPAIRKCEFTPILIKYKEFNDGIMDNVISEIRKSRFVIADYTGNKRGVYYEAGFAYGLGLSVIKCVKEDHLKPDIVAEDKLHFDVQHLNFIVWNDYEVLKNRIINRIQALSL